MKASQFSIKNQFKDVSDYKSWDGNGYDVDDSAIAGNLDEVLLGVHVGAANIAGKLRALLLEEAQTQLDDMRCANRRSLVARDLMAERILHELAMLLSLSPVMRGDVARLHMLDEEFALHYFGGEGQRYSRNSPDVAKDQT